MSGNDFTAKAEKNDNLLVKSNLSAEEKGKLVSFKASHGFLKRFTERQNIIFKNLSGEAASVDDNDNVVNTWKKPLKMPIKNYEPSYVNVDKFPLLVIGKSRSQGALKMLDCLVYIEYKITLRLIVIYFTSIYLN